ncbi:MAG TPA: NAD-dependent epimerase/dehydratase family protein [Verrucomicrobiae bacterium]|nr:NAD-dependent epimerase/dehydratase family protein [Verrucomicrobiae bacterium]
MKVLLTGASGFVGSHILDDLCAHAIPTAALLRSRSSRRFLTQAGERLEVRLGTLAEPASLDQALTGITHVIHCAGRTKAVRGSEFYDTNETGTRNLVAAINRRGAAIQRLVHISSLAVAGPAIPARPARETDPPHPVSDYGRSKLAAECAVKDGCIPPITVIRPPAVYGPRDDGFLPIFQSIKRHLLPRPKAGQALSLVFVKDLARAVTLCLRSPAAAGKTYFVAGERVTSAREMAALIAAQMNVWTVGLPLPTAALWPVCLLQELAARLTGQPALLNLQKFHELRAPGWVCDPSLIQRELGYVCPTTLEQGVAETLKWYRNEKWL